jgi:hypothetical protein
MEGTAMASDQEKYTMSLGEKWKGKDANLPVSVRTVVSAVAHTILVENGVVFNTPQAKRIGGPLSSTRYWVSVAVLEALEMLAPAVPAPDLKEAQAILAAKIEMLPIVPAAYNPEPGQKQPSDFVARADVEPTPEPAQTIMMIDHPQRRRKNLPG